QRRTSDYCSSRVAFLSGRIGLCLVTNSSRKTPPLSTLTQTQLSTVTQAAIGRRYRRQDEIGTPFCITVDGDTATDKCVTIRDRDSLVQERIPVDRIVDEVLSRLKA
ncbi:MAG: His/Gly/Thr/Pro-type tRNA ligase C-terminal domain-containing protein, partial [Planctomycetales bacterium]|nr:His/Gly/Thr/Pro-type tRNA ligase C-terminal domain-containing protein [Planctomycetales bacterium]